MGTDHGAKGLIGQYLKQQHMRHAPVDDVHRVDTAAGGIECATDFGQHAAADGTVGKQFINLACAQVGEQLARLIEHTADVGQHHQLFGFKHSGQLGGDHVGVDVVALVVVAKTNRTDDRNEGVILQGFHHTGVNADDVADLADVVLFARVKLVHHFEFLRANHAAIAPGQSHRFATSLVDQAHNVLLHFAAQHPLHDFHGFGVGDAHALDEFAFFTQALQGSFNLRPAAVYHHRVDAHQFK